MKTLTGQVVSLKSAKTAIVEINNRLKHPLYKKTILRTKRIAVHVENITVSVGSLVTIGEVRPISKTKHFKILK